MIDIVLSDLDSTLSNTLGRAHLTAGDPSTHEDWIPYSKACVNDLPIDGPVRALQLLSKLYPIFIVSGRNVEAIEETSEWLSLVEVPFEELRLRGPQDIRHNGDYKVAYIRELRARGFNPILMLEDHIGVSEMVEAEGVPTITVNPRYEDTVGVNFNHLEEPTAFDSLIQASGTTTGPIQHRRR